MLVPNTTTTATEMLLNKLSLYNMNPSSVQQTILNVLELCLQGEDIVDVTSPFVFTLEAGATGTAAAISASQSVTRQLYPPLAQAQDELYHHFSDRDYVGIFATGGATTIKVMLPYVELQDYAISINGNTNARSVVFPRDTVITANGYDLGICYPIVVNLLPYNIIQVMYDSSITHPLMPLVSNILKHEIVTYNSYKYLQIDVPVIQFTNETNIFPLSASTSFNQNILFTDNFYYVRAYINTGSGSWIPILTTHSYMVYDISKPTLKLQVIGNKLNVTLPDIYQSLNTAGNSLRIDIYSTKGEVNVDLSQIPYTDFSAKWVDYDTLNLNPGVPPLNNINDMIFFSTEMLSGGSNGSTLEQIRNRTIYHINSTLPPIRPTDISIDLSTYGYVTQKMIDSVTNRVYVASKNLPMRTINGLSVTPLATNANVQVNVAQGTVNGLFRRSLITQSVKRSTLTPQAVYMNRSGNISIMSDSMLDDLAALSGSALCDFINNGGYFYSPFHYVIDYTQEVLITKPYYLAAPTINAKAFMASNTARIYNIATLTANIQLVNNIYVLSVTASIPTGITGVHCQISYIDPNSNSTVFLSGTPQIAANIITFTFLFDTNFDINQADELELLNLVNSRNTVSPIFVNLVSTFNLFYLVEGNRTGLETSFDNLYFKGGAMPAVIGATYETITIKFGEYLANLYCPSREIIQTANYQTYPTDVPATYTDIIYKSGSLGYEYILNPDNTVSFTVEHNIGDNVLDANGNQIMLHKAGDYILDAGGQLIPTADSVNLILYQLGVTLIDLKYKYATALATTAYAASIPAAIVGYLDNEIMPSASLLIERTALYYKPMSTPNYLDINIGDSQIVTVSSVLDISITYYLSEESVQNMAIQSNLKDLTCTIISKNIAMPVITLDQLTSDLHAAKPSQVIGIQVNKFLPNGANVVTLVDPGSSFVIGEKLIVLPDGTLEIQDNVTVLFKSAT